MEWGGGVNVVGWNVTRWNWGGGGGGGVLWDEMRCGVECCGMEWGWNVVGWNGGGGMLWDGMRGGMLWNGGGGMVGGGMGWW